jgi:hypothetical protein
MLVMCHGSASALINFAIWSPKIRGKVGQSPFEISRPLDGSLGPVFMLSEVRASK